MLLIVKLWSRQSGSYFCVSTKSASGKWRDNWFHKKEFDDVEEFIKNNLDKNVYFCPHGFTQAERKKEFAVSPKMLYADLDESDPRELDLRPTVALESSPGRFVGFWETDDVAEEALNRRLSYSIGADVSGWDLTQVLRVPNTRNYKYSTTPRVRILWNNGPTYEIRRLEKMIPQLKSVMGDNIQDDAARVFKRYEQKLPRWVRRELIHGKPQRGKRSEVLWKLQNELLEAGLSREESFDLLWVCPWNKFKNRRDGVDQLWRELDKSLEQHFTGYKATTNSDDDDPTAFNPLPRSMADVVMRNINWVVPGMFARGEVTIVEGDPGLGKSYFMQITSGYICDGKTLPTENKYDPVLGRVAYFDTENTADTVTKLRLIENGIENLDSYKQGEEPFSIDDTEKWDRVNDVLEDFRPTLIVFDTVNIYIGGADTYRSSDTQQALVHFKVMAARFDCAVVLLRHLTKSTKEKALYRGQGSIAFTGLARIVLTVGLLPDDQDIRVVACVKNNIGPFMKPFTFRIDRLPDTSTTKNRSKFSWGDFVDLTADDIVNVAPIKNNTKESAVKWLRDQLEGKSYVEYSRLERMATSRSLTKDDLERAATQLAVIKSPRGSGRSKTETWSLPSGDETPSEKESRGRKHLERSTVRRVQFGQTSSRRSA